MGGVYENDYVKENGVWKIEHDQVFNTYFVPYAVGWKNVAAAAAARHQQGQSAGFSADASVRDVPSAFLPPFHYGNPVTGDTVSWSAPE